MTARSARWYDAAPMAVGAAGKRGVQGGELVPRGKKRAVTWPLVVTPAVVFAVGCFVDFILSSSIQGKPAEQMFPAVSGLTVGALTVLTFARWRDAYIAAAGVYSAAAVIGATVGFSVTVRIAMIAACFVAIAASLVAYTLIPERMAVRVRRNDRGDRPKP